MKKNNVNSIMKSSVFTICKYQVYIHMFVQNGEIVDC